MKEIITVGNIWPFLSNISSCLRVKSVGQKK